MLVLFGTDIYTQNNFFRYLLYCCQLPKLRKLLLPTTKEKYLCPNNSHILKERKKNSTELSLFDVVLQKSRQDKSIIKIKIASCSRAGCRLSRVKGRREHKKRLLHAPSFYKSPATCVPLVRRKKTQAAAHTHARNKRARRSHRQACVCVRLGFFIPQHVSVCTLEKVSIDSFMFFVG
jgi:hypothetical protein